MPQFSYRVWLRESLATCGWLHTAMRLLSGGAELARDCLPARRRLRYGDVDFDCDYRVDTTWANVGFRTRLREVLIGRAYQPSDARIFHEMMSRLAIDHRDFTFVDLGSGKGRALLLASDYPFRRIVGVELLPELHLIAQENVRRYCSQRQQCHQFELICGDARDYTLPPVPLIVFLFDPFPEEIFRQVLARVEQSARTHPRKMFFAYENPVFEAVVAESALFCKLGGTEQWAVYEISC